MRGILRARCVCVSLAITGIAATLTGCATTATKPNPPDQPIAKKSEVPAVEPVPIDFSLAVTPLRDALVAKLTSPAARAVPRRPLAEELNWPALWPIDQQYRKVISFYGWRGRREHMGIDIKGPRRTPVMATASGVVKTAAVQHGYGKLVTIDHGNGFETRYGHLDDIRVSSGQEIERGEELGLLGMTGNATCPHVHYEVRQNGKIIDPYFYLPAIAIPDDGEEY